VHASAGQRRPLDTTTCLEGLLVGGGCATHVGRALTRSCHHWHMGTHPRATIGQGAARPLYPDGALHTKPDCKDQPAQNLMSHPQPPSPLHCSWQVGPIPSELRLLDKHHRSCGSLVPCMATWTVCGCCGWLAWVMQQHPPGATLHAPRVLVLFSHAGHVQAHRAATLQGMTPTNQEYSTMPGHPLAARGLILQRRAADSSTHFSPQTAPHLHCPQHRGDATHEVPSTWGKAGQSPWHSPPAQRRRQQHMGALRGHVAKKGHLTREPNSAKTCKCQLLFHTHVCQVLFCAARPCTPSPSPINPRRRKTT